jgi:hypothetical protein
MNKRRVATKTIQRFHFRRLTKGGSDAVCLDNKMMGLSFMFPIPCGDLYYHRHHHHHRKNYHLPITHPPPVSVLQNILYAYHNMKQAELQAIIENFSHF